jgi:thiol-disulfide isomerase/thioredoxin
MLFVAASAACAEAPSAASQTAADSSAPAKQLLTSWIESIRAAKHLSADMAAQVELKKDGEVVQTDACKIRFAFERPQKLAVVLTEGQGASIVNNDKQFYVYHSELGRYQAEPPRAAIADVLSSKLFENVNMGQGLGLIADALSNDSPETIFGRFTSISQVGVEDVDGVKADRLRVVQNEIPIDLWISTDGKRLLKFSPDLMTGLKATGRTPPPGVTLSLTITLSKWSYDAPPPGAFEFTPPADAQLVTDIFAHPLLGKQAPKFEITSLDGKPVSLEALKGKVVVLDFWATWCGPCVAALPKITETTAKYQDKGVVFYAVNQQEEPSIIKEFLAAEKLKVPVALDADGAVGAAFAVQGIPQTVVIDKQGKVQVVHVGAGPDIGDELAKELDAVLAGKDLASETLNTPETK